MFNIGGLITRMGGFGDVLHEGLNDSNRVWGLFNIRALIIRRGIWGTQYRDLPQLEQSYLRS